MAVTVEHYQTTREEVVTIVAKKYKAVSKLVTELTDKYIQGRVLPRLFFSQINQRDLLEAYFAEKLSIEQEQLINAFGLLLKQALLGEIKGIKSLYHVLSTRLCTQIFTAGYYDEKRVKEELIPIWFQTIYKTRNFYIPQHPYSYIPLPTATLEVSIDTNPSLSANTEVEQTLFALLQDGYLSLHQVKSYRYVLECLEIAAFMEVAREFKDTPIRIICDIYKRIDKTALNLINMFQLHRECRKKEIQDAKSEAEKAATELQRYYADDDRLRATTVRAFQRDQDNMRPCRWHASLNALAINSGFQEVFEQSEQAHDHYLECIARNAEANLNAQNSLVSLKKYQEARIAASTACLRIVDKNLTGVIAEWPVLKQLAIRFYIQKTFTKKNGYEPQVTLLFSTNVQKQSPVDIIASYTVEMPQEYIQQDQETGCQLLKL